MSSTRPVSRRWLLNGFFWYARRLVRRNFYLFATDLSSFDYHTLPPSVPLVIFSNHPSWWDPIVGMLLCETYFKDRVFYAPIDADALKKYRVFQKLGYFGIQANSRKGATDFIEQSSYVLSLKTGSLWITPEGRFTDIRDTRQPLMPGLAHLTSMTPCIHGIPLAIEYVFTEERRPLVLCKLGCALSENQSENQSAKWDKADWQFRLTEHLRETQAVLAESVIAKKWDSFDVIVR